MDRAGSSASARVVVILAAGLALAGCQMPAGGFGQGPAAEPASADATGPSQRVIERDVEAPEVFQRQEAGLWDGRPSLGGVWVAHPLATDPERVVIRNTRTGATVIGALFRRERDNPGPRFQVSSEAASALGILAGAPSEIQVTALRLQRVEMEIDPAPAPATAAAETLAVAPVAAAAPASATPAAAPQGSVAISDVEPAPRGSLFGRRNRAQADAPIAQTALAPAEGAPTVAVAPATPQTAATTASSTQTMTELTTPAPEPRRRLRDLFRRSQPEPDTTLIALPGVADASTMPGAAPAAQPTPQPAPQPVARIERPFVQIGIFSVESNAVNARAQIQRAGLAAEIRRGQAGENAFWRVVVGPAASVEERGQILTRVRGLGFADAYAVVR